MFVCNLSLKMQGETDKQRRKREKMDRVKRGLEEALLPLNELLSQTVEYRVNIRLEKDHTIIVEDCKNKELRRVIHNWVKARGLMSTADNMQEVIVIDNEDGTKSTRCKTCGYVTEAYAHDNGMYYHTGHLAWRSSIDDNDGCLGGFLSEHTFAYRRVLGRVIIWHPECQPHLSEQARSQLVWRQRQECWTMLMWCLNGLKLPRDVSYVIIGMAYGVKLKRRTEQ